MQPVVGVSPKQISERRQAARVLDMLDWWAQRFDGHYTQKRAHARRRFRSRVVVYLPESEKIAGESAESTSFDVWSRNISQGGLAFIYRGQIKPDELVVCLDADGAGSHWMRGKVVRSRPVHEGFWEYGLQFTGAAGI